MSNPPPIQGFADQGPVRPQFVLRGRQDVLELYTDKVVITPKGLLGRINKGSTGSKSIPFFAIHGVQFKEASGFTCGYIQFTIPGGVEAKRGVLQAVKDENSFLFNPDQNEVARRIKDYIEQCIAMIHQPKPTVAPALSIADEIAKLSALLQQGVLTQAEFEAAKQKLLR